jgi:hypothetical protein
MAQKVNKPEEIGSKLRKVDFLNDQGMSMVDVIRQIFRDWIAAVGAQTAYIEPGTP